MFISMFKYHITHNILNKGNRDQRTAHHAALKIEWEKTVCLIQSLRKEMIMPHLQKRRLTSLVSVRNFNLIIGKCEFGF